jgi:hypothetical protein
MVSCGFLSCMGRLYAAVTLYCVCIQFLDVLELLRSEQCSIILKNVRSCLFVIPEKTLVSSLVVQVLIVLDKSFTVYNRFTLRKKIPYANLMS